MNTEQKFKNVTKKCNDENTVLASVVCEIINDKFSWVMKLDGHTILFSGIENANYFAETFKKLGYKIVWDKDKWQRE